MSVNDIAYLPENPAHDRAIEQINAEAFGPGRFTRAAYKIREGGPHERDLSYVAVHWGKVIGSVRMTRIAAGEGRALLLGPLAVIPDWKNLGIGRKLLDIVVTKAKEQGWGVVLLVGLRKYPTARSPCRVRSIRSGCWRANWSRARWQSSRATWCTRTWR
jgi:predicted N-acetyltransferase YhbS